MTPSQPALPFSCSWATLGELWPSFEPQEGLLACQRASELSLLLIGCALPDEERGGWRTSCIIDDLHVAHRGFASQVEARLDAEQTLTGYLRQYARYGHVTSVTEFDNPVEEVLAQLAAILGDEWQVAHITQYRREWVAVCISNDRMAAEDFAFTRDSFGELGPRAKEDCSVRFDLEDPRHLAVRARLLGGVTLPSPYGDVGISFFRDPASRWLFGVDSSYLEKEVADTVRSPFAPTAFLDVSDEGPAPAEAVRLSAHLVAAQLGADTQALDHEEGQARFVGALVFPDPQTGQETGLSLFESGGLFALESSFLQRGGRAIVDLYSGDGESALTLPDLGSQELVAVEVEAFVCRGQQR